MMHSDSEEASVEHHTAPLNYLELSIRSVGNILG